VCVGLALGVACGVAGCAGSTSGGPQGPEGTTGKRDTEFKHEPCDLSSSKAEIMNADTSGRPVIITVKKGDLPACRAVDFKRDGTIDVFVYYDDQGRERRREYGFDHPDRPNEIQYFQNGQLVRKERDTNNAGKIDTWEYYEGGQLVREERDTAGDGVVHEWWTFPQPGNVKCGVVISDVDGTGKPKPETRVDMCAGESAAAASATAAADAGAPDAGPRGAVPDAGPGSSEPAEESTP
jgi:hypothetical protein